jgi:hypothetical protein
LVGDRPIRRSVNEAVAATGEAYVALWRFLLPIDLTRTVKFSSPRSTIHYRIWSAPQRAGDTYFPACGSAGRPLRHVRLSVLHLSTSADVSDGCCRAMPTWRLVATARRRNAT